MVFVFILHLPVELVMKDSSKWRYFRLFLANFDAAKEDNFVKILTCQFWCLLPSSPSWHVLSSGRNWTDVGSFWPSSGSLWYAYMEFIMLGVCSTQVAVNITEKTSTWRDKCFKFADTVPCASRQKSRMNDWCRVNFNWSVIAWNMNESPAKDKKSRRKKYDRHFDTI